MRCKECNMEMKTVNLIGDMSGMHAYIARKEKGMLNPEKRSDIKASVCPKCGRIELKAEKPEVFL